MSSTGSHMLAVEDVETYFARAVAFRARASDADETAARQRIFYDESEEPIGKDSGALLTSRRPFIVLRPELLHYQPDGVGRDTVLVANGGVIALITDNPRTPENYKESFRDFWNWITSVTDEISQNVRSDAYFQFSMTLIQPPYRKPLTERASDDYWETVFLFTYQ